MLNIAVITHMSVHKMKRIARFTQTLIAPSLNVIDKNFVLGKCDKFRVEKPKVTQKMSVSRAKNESPRAGREKPYKNLAMANS